jgi:phage terminase large subunit-like protein
MFRGTGKLGIDLINPGVYGDKVARVHAIQHLFADEMIFAPDKAWADMVIDQCAVFPKGSRDDLVDSTSQALRYLRDSGFALKREEYATDATEEMMYRSPSNNAPLYPV